MGREDWLGGRAELRALKPVLGGSRMAQELEWSLAPDAYWRQATWRRLTAIFAGPAVNLAFAIVLFTALFMVAAERNTNVIGRVLQGSPAATAHLHAGDRILKVDGVATTPKQIPKRIRATKGRPFEIVVKRDGKRLVIGPLRARED